MSRVAKTPIVIPSGIEILLNDNGLLLIKGKLGQASIDLHPFVVMHNNSNVLVFNITKVAKKIQKSAWQQVGTARVNVANFIKGVSVGWEKKLSLIGVGYRAQINGKNLALTLGFSHVINYQVPSDVEVTIPSPTEITVRGINKQRVGQVAAEIRAYRKPESYKGKGIRYVNEQVFRKEAKKNN